jgi:hypothetical protein
MLLNLLSEQYLSRQVLFLLLSSRPTISCHIVTFSLGILVFLNE